MCGSFWRNLPGQIQIVDSLPIFIGGAYRARPWIYVNRIVNCGGDYLDFRGDLYDASNGIRSKGRIETSILGDPRGDYKFHSGTFAF